MSIMDAAYRPALGLCALPVKIYGTLPADAAMAQQGGYGVWTGRFLKADAA